MFFFSFLVVKLFNRLRSLYENVYLNVFRLLVAELPLYVLYRRHQRLSISYDIDGMHYAVEVGVDVVADNCCWVKLKPLKMCLSRVVVVQCCVS